MIYSYGALRYVHDGLTEEFVTVGLAMHFQDGKVLVRVRDSADRVRTVFPKITDQRVGDVMEGVRTAMERTESVLLDDPPAPVSGSDETPDMAYQERVRISMYGRLESTLDESAPFFSWSAAGSGEMVSGTHEDAFERIWKRFVIWNDPDG